jgi:hypothetical protein
MMDRKIFYSYREEHIKWDIIKELYSTFRVAVEKINTTTWFDNLTKFQKSSMLVPIMLVPLDERSMLLEIAQFPLCNKGLQSLVHFQRCSGVLRKSYEDKLGSLLANFYFQRTRTSSVHFKKTQQALDVICIQLESTYTHMQIHDLTTNNVNTTFITNTPTTTCTVKTATQDQEYYEVDSIKRHRYSNRELYYLIKWKGSDSHGRPWKNSWVHYTCVESAPIAVNKYRKSVCFSKMERRKRKRIRNKSKRMYMYI